jgi:hypothetical protein
MIMFGNALFWLGLIGLVSGIMVGISLLEDSDSFIRNVMFSIGIVVVMFVFIFQLGEADPVRIVGDKLGPNALLVFSFFIGMAAGTAIAFSVHANMRAAAVAGGLAGLTAYLMSNHLPSGSFGYTGLHDIPSLLDIAVTMIAGGLAYYLLRNWGREDL